MAPFACYGSLVINRHSEGRDMEIRMKNQYPDVWAFPRAEAVVTVGIAFPGSGGEVTKDVKGVRKVYGFRSILDADAMFAKIAEEMRAGYRSGKFKLSPGE